MALRARRRTNLALGSEGDALYHSGPDGQDEPQGYKKGRPWSRIFTL